MSRTLHNTGYRTAAAAPRVSASVKAWTALVFVMMALSSIVQHEPAPYDLMLMGGMALFVLTGQQMPRRLAWPGMTVVLLLTGYAIGTMFARQEQDSLLYIRTSTYLSISLLFFAAIVWRAPERVVPAMAAGLVIASVIAASLAIAGYFGAIPNAEAFALYGRATGPFKDPNVFGPSLIFPILYLLHRLVTRRALDLLWSLPVMLLLMLGLFLSFSRGAWMDFTVAALVFLTLTYATGTPADRTRLTGFTIVLFVAGALAIGWVLTKPGVRDLFVQRFAVSQDYDSGEGGRFDNMLNAFKTALANPFGIGPDQWTKISPSGLMPHNIYVNVFVSGGLLSLIGFLSLTLMTLWTGFRALYFNPPLKGVLIAALGVFMGHAMEGLLIDSNHWRHLYVVGGIIWGLSLAGETRTRRAAPQRTIPSAPLQSWSH